MKPMEENGIVEKYEIVIENIIIIVQGWAKVAQPFIYSKF